MARGIATDLSGQRIGILTVVSPAPSVMIGGKPRRAFTCTCDCGVTKVISSHALMAPNRKSCGCLEYAREAKRPIELMYRYAKARAIKYKDKCFEFTLEQFEALSLGDCTYCGTPPMNKYRQKLIKGHNILPYNGIDRMDSSEGYTLNNCVSCCPTCNTMKNSLSYEAFITHIKLLYTRLCTG